jgi:NitT/TauT family transport system permease protein
MPMIALVPLLMIWLGYGINVKIITVALQAFPVIMLNAITGFLNVDSVKHELMKSLGATRIQTLCHLIIPSSGRFIFTGLKLGSIFATIAAISSEFTGGAEGLGFKIFTSISFLRTELAFGGIVCIAIIGISFYSFISLMERKLIQWAE